MKKGLLLCMALVLCLGLSGCGRVSTQEDPLATAKVALSPAQVVEAVAADQAFNELTPLTENQILEYLDINRGLMGDMAMSMDASRMTPEVIAVLVGADEESAKVIREAMAAYRDVTLEQYKDYRPDEVPKLENAVIETKDNMVALIVSQDAEQAKKSLDAAW